MNECAINLNKTEHNPDDELTDTAGSRSYLSFDYQSTCAAILSLKLVETPHIYEQLFCEHHDDILLKRTDGRYVAVQVKSRGSTRELLKSSDEEVTTALKNFVTLDKTYPNRFTEFHLVTNFGFWKANNSGNNLPYILSLLSEKKTTSAIHPTNSFSPVVDELMKYANDEMHLLKVLCKVKPISYPDFDSIELCLALQVRTIFNLGTRSYDAVTRVARRLVEYMAMKSKMHTECLFRTHEILFDGSTGQLEKAVIEEKTVTANLVKEIISNEIGQKIVLRTRDQTRLKPSQSNLHTTEKKLAHGLITLQNIDYLLDCKHNAWEFFIEGLDKEDPDTIDRYDHLRMIVLGECIEAHDNTYSEDKAFGQEMLKEIRNRLRGKRVPGLNDIDSEYVLLLGITGILTEECEIWWSKEFEIEEGF